MYQPNDGLYERDVTPVERYFSHSPTAIVSVAARIRGEMSDEALRSAAQALERRHPILRCRIAVSEAGQPRFTSDGGASPAVLVLPRRSDSHWLDVARDQSRIPFDFTQESSLRVVLLRGEACSDLLFVCHHIICDGLSLAYLMRDLLEALADPTATRLEATSPQPIQLNAIPAPARPGWFMRFIVKSINRKWKHDRVCFDQADYVAMHDAYWESFEHDTLSIGLSEHETEQIVRRCREQQITATTALTAAFSGAGQEVLGRERHGYKVGVAVNLRDRLTQPVGEVMGFYAGLSQLDFKHRPNEPFWTNAQRLKRILEKSLSDKEVFRDPALWCLLDPTIIEAINFKRLGALVAESNERSQKLQAFSSKNDVVAKILKRKGLDQLKTTVMGTAVTNLGRVDLPTHYGDLEFERLFLYPGSGLPLTNIPLVVGVVTCANRLSVVVQHERGTVTPLEAQRITQRALTLLEIEHT